MSTVLRAMAATVPAANPRLLACAGASFVLMVAFYYLVQFGFSVRGKTQTERQRSWVLTSLSSAIMTTVSLPFVWHWLKTGEVDLLHTFADHCCCFFVAYLASDLFIGSIHYRSSISLLTGWIHHIAYMLLLTFFVIPRNFSSIFGLCSILELPTFLLAAGSLNPAFRNDYVFAVVFFLTRIVLHIYLGAQYAIRAATAGGSWAPTIVLACALPMHVLWMHACVAGILRRRAAVRKVTTTTPSTFTATAAPVAIGTASLGPGAAPRLRNLPAYLLSRPLVTSALEGVRARRFASATLLRRSRQHVLRLLHEALRDADAHPAAGPPHSQQAQHPLLQQHQSLGAAGGVGVVARQPPWRSIRRRVAGRIRSSLPDYEGVVVPAIVAEVDVPPISVAVATAA